MCVYIYIHTFVSVYYIHVLVYKNKDDNIVRALSRSDGGHWAS